MQQMEGPLFVYVGSTVLTVVLDYAQILVYVGGPRTNPPHRPYAVTYTYGKYNQMLYPSIEWLVSKIG